MTNKAKSVPDFKNLSTEEKQQAILAMFDEDEREYAESLLQTIDPDELTYDSLRMLVDEVKLLGGIGSGFINVARENYDLREKIRKERRFSIISVVAICICLGLIALLLYLFAVYPKYKVVQTIDNSVICELKPENNPMLTDVAIQDFAKSAVLSAYSFNYINYRDEINNATTRYFTTEGRTAFNRALRTSGSLDHIISNNLIMKSIAISAPQIEEKGVDNKGRSYWIVRMPITTEFFTGQVKAADSQSFVAQVRVVTTDRDAFNPKGLGVYSLTLRPYKQGR